MCITRELYERCLKKNIPHNFDAVVRYIDIDISDYDKDDTLACSIEHLFKQYNIYYDKVTSIPIEFFNEWGFHTYEDVMDYIKKKKDFKVVTDKQIYKEEVARWLV